MKIVVLRTWIALLAATASLPVTAQQVPRRKAVVRSTKPNYEVRGQLTNAPAGTRVYITDFVAGKHVPLDSALTDADGRFRVRGAVAGPVLRNLRVHGREQAAGLALTPGSHLQVRGDATQLWRTGEVTGSKEVVALSAMNREHARILKRVDELAQQRQATTDTVALRKIEQEWSASFAAMTAASKRVASTSSYVAPFVAASFLSGGNGDIAFVDSATTRYARQWPTSPYTKQLLRYQVMRRATVVGQVAPAIQLPTPESQLLALSSLRGKYVLVDFWASWCKPCREENASLVRLYRQYQPKGFEVYGVSVDSKKDAWTTAIQQDKLPWSQVWDVPSETSVASTVYDIYQYPTSFLLDPQGRIIAKDLRGAALAQKLAELLP
ncbi:redoxin domain-containing protein [Hymenobacter norwichensis]|uniref:redoxin domain-containing protein n=1 Tax=Hymenobacter norwichensis TaxID=223903 RepID=UPI0003F5C861|nr:redoxin domain-containing protein [Hymenobacter norwichensis]